MSYNLLTVKYVQIPAIRKSLYIYIYINVIKKKKSYFIWMYYKKKEMTTTQNSDSNFKLTYYYIVIITEFSVIQKHTY